MLFLEFEEEPNRRRGDEGADDEDDNEDRPVAADPIVRTLDRSERLEGRSRSLSLPFSLAALCLLLSYSRRRGCCGRRCGSSKDCRVSGWRGCERMSSCEDLIRRGEEEDGGFEGENRMG